MGVSDSIPLIKAIAKPLENCVRDCNRYTCDNCSFHSNCCKIVEIDMQTHPHQDEFESASEGDAASGSRCAEHTSVGRDMAGPENPGGE